MEIGLPTLRVASYNHAQNQQSHLTDLDYLKGKRLVAQLRAENYKRKTKLYHDSKLRVRKINLGDWVLLDRKAQTEGAKQPKLEPSWEGPYQVGQVIREGTYKLQRSDGTWLSNPWHVDHLKKYYL